MRKGLEGPDTVRIFMVSGCRGNKKIKVMKKEDKDKEIEKLIPYLKDQIEFYNSLPHHDHYRPSILKHIEVIKNRLDELKK
jgi:hypothetical protein